MTQINLLPWREQARQIKKTRLAIFAALVAAAAIILALITHFFMSALADSQERNNNFIQAELTQEQSALTELNKQKRNQKIMDTELQYIFSLQQRSYKAVHLLDALVHVVPDGVLLVRVARVGDQVTLVGEAQSNLQVTMLMENMAKTKIFNQPVLSDISQAKTPTENINRTFQVVVQQQE